MAFYITVVFNSHLTQIISISLLIFWVLHLMERVFLLEQKPFQNIIIECTERQKQLQNLKGTPKLESISVVRIYIESIPNVVLL